MRTDLNVKPILGGKMQNKFRPGNKSPPTLILSLSELGPRGDANERIFRR
jgi:hypothetical protein